MNSASIPSPQPIIIHLCGGAFLVWDADTARTLAMQYRIIGAWSGQRATATASKPVPVSAAASSSTDCSISADAYPLQTFPLVLSASQVLALVLGLLPASSSSDFSLSRPSLRLIRGSISSLLNRRGRGGESAQDDRVARLVRERVSIVSATLEKQARIQAEIRAKFEHVKRKPKKERKEAAIAMVDVEANAQPEASCADNTVAAASPSTAGASSLDDGAPSAKRQRLVASSTAVAASSSSTTVVNPCFPDAVAVDVAPSTVDEMLSAVRSSTLPLPRCSTLHIAACSFPLTRATLEKHSDAHPLAMQLTMSSSIDAKSIVLERRLMPLELHNTLVHEMEQNEEQSEEEMETLLYQGICDALGLSLHNCTSNAAPSAAASSPVLHRFLCLTFSFLHLHRSGFFLIPGLHFGCDWTCYEDLPSKVHSSFMVKVRQTIEEGQVEPEMESVERANLARMATGVGKVVLIMQPIVPKEVEDTTAAIATPAAPCSSSTASSSSSCSCLSSFRSCVSRFSRLRFSTSTFHWNSNLGELEYGPFPDEDMRRTHRRMKRPGEKEEEEEDRS